jgi:hypothetical protein
MMAVEKGGQLKGRFIRDWCKCHARDRAPDSSRTELKLDWRVSKTERLAPLALILKERVHFVAHNEIEVRKLLDQPG